jgi:hypothetical protein
VGNTKFTLLHTLFEPTLFEPTLFEPTLFEPTLFEPTLFEPTLFEPTLFEPTLFEPTPTLFELSGVRMSLCDCIYFTAFIARGTIFMYFLF